MVNLGIFLGFFLPCFPNSLAYSYSSSIHSLWEIKPMRDSPRSERSVSIMRNGVPSASCCTRMRIRGIPKNRRGQVLSITFHVDLCHPVTLIFSYSASRVPKQAKKATAHNEDGRIIGLQCLAYLQLTARARRITCRKFVPSGTSIRYLKCACTII